MILNEKIMSNLDFKWKTTEKQLFFLKISENAWFFGLFALRAKKEGLDKENHTRWGPEGAPPEAKRQKAQPFGEIWKVKLPQERQGSFNSKIF